MAPAAGQKFLVHQKKFVSEVQEQNDRNNINFCGGRGTTLKWRSIGSHLNGSWKEFFSYCCTKNAEEDDDYPMALSWTILLSYLPATEVIAQQSEWMREILGQRGFRGAISKVRGKY